MDFPVPPPASIVCSMRFSRRATRAEVFSYNTERTDETRYRVTFAVAGFNEKDLHVELRDGVLTVTGKGKDNQKQHYLYQDSAGRAFERRFQLAEHVEGRTVR